MRHYLLIVVILTFLASPTTAAAEPFWQPAGDWSIEQGDHCVGVLLFTHKSTQLKFAIEPDPTKPANIVYFITEGDADYPYGWTRADIAVGKKWKDDQGLQIVPSAQPQHVTYKWGLSDEGLGEVETTGRIQVNGKDLRLDLALPGMTSARARLRACDSALLTRWGFGPEQQARIAYFPKIEKLNIKDSDYPVAAAKRGSIGDVRGYLTVGADGKASDCRILDSSGWPALDTQSCQLLVDRGQYKPRPTRRAKRWRRPFISNSTGAERPRRRASVSFPPKADINIHQSHRRSSGAGRAVAGRLAPRWRGAPTPSNACP